MSFNIRKKGLARIKNYESCKCSQGHIHHSRGEAGWCNNLELRVRAGDIQSYEGQKRFDFVVNGKKICSHIPDFFVTGADGSVWVEEFKGFEADVWKLKKKMFAAFFPDIRYVVIKPSGKVKR